MFFSVQLSEDHNSVVLLDQRRLPHYKEYQKFYCASQVADAIREMVVRGAPAIGVAASFGVAVEAHRLVVGYVAASFMVYDLDIRIFRIKKILKATKRT